MKGRSSTGIILIVIGMLFLVQKFAYFSVFSYIGRIFSTFFRFWPVLLIVIGIYYLISGNKRQENNKYNDFKDIDYISKFNIFSSLEEKINSQNFRGGEITTIFGGSEIDLMECKINPEECRINLFTMFGGIEINTPENCNIIMTGVPIFGGSEIKRKKLDRDGPIVYIKYFVLFGGIEIY